MNTGLDNLRHAIEKYNSYGYPLFMETPAFNELLSARNRAFKKKILLINLRDAAINAHLERAFVRAISSLPGNTAALDIFHSFAEDYGFIGRGNPTGFRIKYSGMANLKAFTAKTRYDALVFIDLPYRDEEFLPFAWLALRDRTPEKHFLADDSLAACPGIKLFALELAGKLRVFDAFSTACVMNQCELKRWARYGRPAGGLSTRDLAVDCDYYKPYPSENRNYIFSCGRLGRNFELLLKAVKTLPRLKLKLYTDLPVKVPSKLRNRVEFVPYTAAASRMRELLAGASFVVLPVEESGGNPGAGLSVALLSMAMGRIVLTHGGAVVHRYLKDGRNAFTYGELSAEALTQGIKRILSLDARKKAGIEANARASALKLNNMDLFVQKYLAALPTLSTSRARPQHKRYQESFFY